MIPEPLAALLYCLDPYPKKLGISWTLTVVIATTDGMEACATAATVPFPEAVSAAGWSDSLSWDDASCKNTLSVVPICVVPVFVLKYLSAVKFSA